MKLSNCHSRDAFCMIYIKKFLFHLYSKSNSHKTFSNSNVGVYVLSVTHTNLVFFQIINLSSFNLNQYIYSILYLLIKSLCIFVQILNLLKVSFLFCFQILKFVSIFFIKKFLILFSNSYVGVSLLNKFSYYTQISSLATFTEYVQKVLLFFSNWS